jgi:hypothetical protein
LRMLKKSPYSIYKKYAMRYYTLSKFIMECTVC